MTKDLVVLVADAQQETTIRALLDHRQASLSIKAITYDIFRHPGKDSGVFHQPHNILNACRPPRYQYVLALLDCAWGGSPGGAAPVRRDLLTRLTNLGWQAGTCEVIAIEPELEIWVWSRSPHVPQILRTSWDDIHALAQQRGFWVAGTLKPHQPKALLEALLQQQRRPRSSAIFQELARQVRLQGCHDAAFVLLRDTLRRWFGQES
jgi:hypothetical protein